MIFLIHEISKIIGHSKNFDDFDPRCSYRIILYKNKTLIVFDLKIEYSHSVSTETLSSNRVGEGSGVVVKRGECEEKLQLSPS